MSLQGALVSVAQYEFKALVQDTKDAIGSLKCQRASVMQAIETAQQAIDHPGHPHDDTGVLVTRLMDELQRLSAALDQVIDEVEHIQDSPISPSAEPFPVLPLYPTLILNQKHPHPETNLTE
jgi:hypothetical protein